MVTKINLFIRESSNRYTYYIYRCLTHICIWAVPEQFGEISNKKNCDVFDLNKNVRIFSFIPFMFLVFKNIFHLQKEDIVNP